MMLRLRENGFTLIELLVALLILSVLALMSYRGLGAVLDARQHVREESDKWRRVATFFARFERDVQQAAPRTVRTASGDSPAWMARADNGAPAGKLHLEFSRFGFAEGVDSSRRVAYHLNEKQEIELWLWPGLDVAPNATPARHPVLSGVAKMELQYLNTRMAWTDAWPNVTGDPAIPRAVRVSIVLASGERLTRVFSLQS